MPPFVWQDQLREAHDKEEAKQGKSSQAGTNQSLKESTGKRRKDRSKGIPAYS